MAWETPTLQDVVNRAARAFDGNLEGADAKLWPNNVAVSAKVIGGAVWPAYEYLDFIARQRFVHLAEGEFLDKHAKDWGMARLQPTYARGKATFSGTDATTIPAGAELRRSDDERYLTTSSGTITSGTVDIEVKAVASGSAGNALGGVVLSPINAISGVTSIAVSNDGIGNGADLERDPPLRERVLVRKRLKPQGGAAHDYWQWTREVNAGISHVFVDPVTESNGRASVGIWFLMYGVYADGLPQAADVDAVADYIETQRPAGAVVDVGLATADTTDITINGLEGDTQATRDAIELELRDFFRREMRVSTLTDPFTLRRSRLVEAISQAAGEMYHDTTSLPADTVVAAGHIPTLGTVSFT
jgi:uncharacterized phage protein gp47/JayE